MKSSQCLTGRKWARGHQCQRKYVIFSISNEQYNFATEVYNLCFQFLPWYAGDKYHMNMDFIWMGKDFWRYTWKIIERPIDWLLSNSFEIQFGWVENQLRKRLALKFGFSNSQKWNLNRCDKKVCQPELDKNKHWPHVFNRLADGVFFFQISKFHLCIIKKRNIQQTYYLSNVWPAH